MTAFKEDQKRNVVPRWRDSLRTLASGELRPLPHGPEPVPASIDLLADKLADWQRHRSPAFASDLVSAGLVLGRLDEVREAAEYLLASDRESISPAVKRLATIVIAKGEPTDEDFLPDEPVDPKSEKEAVHRLRGRLRREPRNAILWVDLARHYTTLGLPDQALRSMDRGVAAAPTHRFTLRSATRLHVHVQDPERGLHMLKRSGAIERDPWLLSAEIAVTTLADQLGSRRASRLLKTGRALVESGKLEPEHTAELASALGTVALQSGDRRQARKMFAHALIAPTDNAVAQVEWAARRLTDIVVERKHLDAPLSFEARAWEFYAKSEWDRSLMEARRWMADEPFSSRSAIFGTYVASTAAENLDEAIRFARAGLVSNPSDQTLLNNLAVALAGSGRARDALGVLQRMDLAAQATPSLLAARTATTGLVAFRLGDTKKGQALYREAAELANKAGLPHLRALALAYLAREEMVAGLPTAHTVLAEAEAAGKDDQSAALRAFLTRLRFRRTLAASLRAP